LVVFLAPQAVLAQDAPAAPDDGPADTPSADAPAEPTPAAAPSVEPSEPAPPPDDAVPAPPPPRRQRYDGEQRDDNAAAYEDDSGDDSAGDDEGDQGGGMPGFSIRIDPFNWLLEGRLGLELEVVAWKFISVELVPVFVANSTPPSFNLSGRDDSISQESNGIGPISGASIGAGFWLSGEPLRGYVLRAVLTNYGYTYKASDSAGVFDHVNVTERRFFVYFGSHSRWGAFTIAGGIGLGYELNQQQRCFANDDIDLPTSSSAVCGNDGELRIALDPSADAQADLNGGFHPIYLAARFSLGVAFD